MDTPNSEFRLTFTRHQMVFFGCFLSHLTVLRRKSVETVRGSWAGRDRQWPAVGYLNIWTDRNWLE